MKSKLSFKKRAEKRNINIVNAKDFLKPIVIIPTPLPLVMTLGKSSPPGKFVKVCMNYSPMMCYCENLNLYKRCTFVHNLGYARICKVINEPLCTI